MKKSPEEVENERHLFWFGAFIAALVNRSPNDSAKVADDSVKLAEERGYFQRAS